MSICDAVCVRGRVRVCYYYFGHTSDIMQFVYWGVGRGGCGDVMVVGGRT